MNTRIVSEYHLFTCEQEVIDVPSVFSKQNIQNTTEVPSSETNSEVISKQ